MVFSTLAVLAASLAFAAAASFAGDNDGGQGADKVWVCHFVPGVGEHGGYDLIEVARPAWDNAHSEGDVLATWNGSTWTCPGAPDDGKKVTICHKPEGQNPMTMDVPESAVEGHLGHGDSMGVCPTSDKWVTICHKPEGQNPMTKDVPESAVEGHLGHGDTLGPCVTTYTGSAPYSLTQSVCFNGAMTSVTVSGNASATSTESQAAADAAATAAAPGAASAAMANELSTKYPGYTATCPTTPSNPTTPTTTTTTTAAAPVTAVEAATVPETVVSPEAATTPAKPAKPAKVAPEAATVPAVVPAGGGSAADQGVVPAWALALLALGTLGLAGSSVRLAVARAR